MFNSFPYDSWLLPDGSLNEQLTDFWTWGGHNSAGTFVQLALGAILMVAAFIGWVWLEKQKLDEQAAALRASGAFSAPAPMSPPSSPTV